jgi:hypothetical protein
MSTVSGGDRVGNRLTDTEGGHKRRQVSGSLERKNVGQGPAKDISFEFSAPVESSDGFVLSELPFFAEGMTSLAPGAKIGCYWDTLDNLLPLMKEGKIASDITVTVRYKDLNLTPWSTTGRSPPGSTRA